MDATLVPHGFARDTVEKISVLDQGYVSLVTAWGSDESIIEAARMSTDKGFEGWGTDECNELRLGGLEKPCVKGTKFCESNHGDQRLLSYLWKNRHTTPFEMAGATFEIQAPIFVFREWHRHRTQSYNELSGRYTKIPDMNYVPTPERLLVSGGGNKQAGSMQDAPPLSLHKAIDWLLDLDDLYAQAEKVYQKGLEIGVPKEIARLPVPVARYSKMRASSNLLNWLKFLTLRVAKNAQWEIQQFANAVASFIEKLFPRTFLLWKETSVL